MNFNLWIHLFFAEYIFNRYYNGECIAPILTVFVGGNHESSHFLQELPYGGWVAPNIYYMGKIFYTSDFKWKLITSFLFYRLRQCN